MSVVHTLRSLERTPFGDLRREVENLEAIREWAIRRAASYGVGDRVQIVAPIPFGTPGNRNGWWPYREALAIGATGAAGEFWFINSDKQKWCVDFCPDRAWTYHEDTGVRRWKGPEGQRPEGYAQGGDTPPVFMLDVGWLAPIQGGAP